MINDRGAQTGPHTLSELAALASAGTISPMALAWRPGLLQWIAVSSIVPMPAYGPPGQAQPMFYAPPPAGDSNRIAAGICGILIGGLGIHKFVLGFTGAGLTMLLVTILTCGWGGIVMGIIGLIEGITYLTKSEAQFYQDYVVNRKQWF